MSLQVCWLGERITASFAHRSRLVRFSLSFGGGSLGGRRFGLNVSFLRRLCSRHLLHKLRILVGEVVVSTKEREFAEDEKETRRIV